MKKPKKPMARPITYLGRSLTMLLDSGMVRGIVVAEWSTSCGGGEVCVRHGVTERHRWIPTKEARMQWIKEN
jgi:hypothetical protein